MTPFSIQMLWNKTFGQKRQHIKAASFIFDKKIRL